MRLRRLTIENFRAYREPTSIVFEPFTSVIGRNDVGKSTLLEALEIFFNGGKPDPNDAHVRGRGRPTRISCEFDDLPGEVVIDATAHTSLEHEHLLNEHGLLEIVKEFDLSAARIVPKVYARALHPLIEECRDLLQLSNQKLKTRATTLGLDLAGVDQRINKELRSAIRAHIGAHEKQPTLVALNEEDAKKVWSFLQKEMPTYALFRADRPSMDDDAEITSPMDVAVKDAVRMVEAKLDEIKDEVKRRVEDVTQRTLTKLREMDPSLADDLRPVFKTEPKWAGFKLSLHDHEDIPINKRGSGVRRLILMNFFRAEAERRQEATNAPGVIFAIEEPESSQHPLNQELLVGALLDLSAVATTQVIITTHVPGIASLVPPAGVRYVRRDEARHPRIMHCDEDVLKLVADELGVLPDRRVKVLVYVEGPNDVSFLEHTSRLVSALDLSADPRVAFVVTGGGNLKHWINERYLSGLGLREIHIYDRDNDFGYAKHVEMINSRNNGDWATLTGKREIENYIHPMAIRSALGIDIDFDDDDDVGAIVAHAIHEAAPDSKPWVELDEDEVKRKISRAKKRLCTEAAASMTHKMLRESDPKLEVEGWLERITETVA